RPRLRAVHRDGPAGVPPGPSRGGESHGGRPIGSQFRARRQPQSPAGAARFQRTPMTELYEASSEKNRREIEKFEITQDLLQLRNKDLARGMAIRISCDTLRALALRLVEKSSPITDEP